MTTPEAAGALDVVVFVGSTWSRLAQRTTRWRELCVRLAAHRDVARLTVIDFVRFSLRRPTNVAAADSWLNNVRCLGVDVRADRRWPLPTDALAWRSAAEAINVELGPLSRPRLVLCANPLAAPLALRLDATSYGFDAYDDWRQVAHLATPRRRIEAGYGDLVMFDSLSAVSDGLASRLAAEQHVHPTVVRNGVDVQRFARGGPPPQGVPAGAFAVYVGAVERRVDVELLAASTTAMPVVVAGEMAEDVRRQLTDAGVICLGAIPADDVPGLLHAAAVGLVPHRIDALTTTMDPLKVLEYRAAGLPVVATEVPGTDVDGVDVPGTREEWPAAIRAAAARGASPAPGLRDWSLVTEELLAVHLPEEAIAADGPPG